MAGNFQLPSNQATPSFGLKKTDIIALDFEKLDKKGLKTFLDKFKRKKMTVKNVEAKNTARRANGVLQKEFTMEFQDGQKIQIFVKGDGTIFQVKLNEKVIPIRNTTDLDRAVEELVAALQKNAKSILSMNRTLPTLQDKLALQKIACEGTARLQAGIADPDKRQKVQAEVRDALDKLAGETTPREQQGEAKPAKPWRATIRPKPTLEEYKRLLAGDYNHLPPEEFWEVLDSICTAEAAKRFEFWGITPTPDELEKKTVDLLKLPANNYLDFYYDEERGISVYVKK